MKCLHHMKIYTHMDSEILYVDLCKFRETANKKCLYVTCHLLPNIERSNNSADQLCGTGFAIYRLPMPTMIFHRKGELSRVNTKQKMWLVEPDGIASTHCH